MHQLHISTNTTLDTVTSSGPSGIGRNCEAHVLILSVDYARKITLYSFVPFSHLLLHNVEPTGLLNNMRASL